MFVQLDTVIKTMYKVLVNLAVVTANVEMIKALLLILRIRRKLSIAHTLLKTGKELLQDVTNFAILIMIVEKHLQLEEHVQQLVASVMHLLQAPVLVRMRQLLSQLKPW